MGGCFLGEIFLRKIEVFSQGTVLGKKKYTILAKRQTHNYHSCSVCFSGSTIQLWSHPTRIPKIMITAHLTTLHETSKVARCHFENGCFSHVKKSYLSTSGTSSIDVLERLSWLEWLDKSQQSCRRLSQPCGDTLGSTRVWGFHRTARVCGCTMFSVNT